MRRVADVLEYVILLGCVILTLYALVTVVA